MLPSRRRDPRDDGAGPNSISLLWCCHVFVPTAADAPDTF